MKIWIIALSLFVSLSHPTLAGNDTLSPLLSGKVKSGKVLHEMNILIEQYQVTKDKKKLEAVISHLPTILKKVKTYYIVESFYPLQKKKDKNYQELIKKHLNANEIKEFNKRLNAIKSEIEGGNG